ncbi:MAG: hypothetical protein O8C56_12080, partial [Candidatus Methanoperedens sp.]|nr:hypothetical protein [Candidatus Methanoperedens sp.]
RSAGSPAARRLDRRERRTLVRDGPDSNVETLGWFLNVRANPASLRMLTPWDQIPPVRATDKPRRSTRASLPGKNTKQKFMEFSYAFIPLGLSVYLAENTFRLLKGLFFLAENAGKVFGRVWQFDVNFDTINQAQILILLAGFIFSVWAGYLISKRQSVDHKEFRQSMTAISVTAIIYLFIGVRILTLPIV